MSTQTPGKAPNSSPPPSTPSPERLAFQLHVFKILALVLVILLVVGGGAFWYIRRVGQPVTVLLDGKPIATVRNAATADRLLGEAQKAVIGNAYPEDSVVRLQKVQLRPADRNGIQDPDSAAKKKLASNLRLHVRCYAIVVNKQVSLGLPTQAEAEETLRLVKDHFASLPPQAEITQAPKFMERVAIKVKSLDASRTRSSASQAASYFWTPPPSKTYTVHRGDTGLVIARHNHMSLSDFIAANSGVNINRLTPGQEVNVQKMPLLLTVSVHKQVTQEEKVIKGAPAWAAGRQSVTYDVTYINGQETSRESGSAIIIEPAHARSSL